MNPPPPSEKAIKHAELVRDIVRMMVSGMPYYRIVDIMRERGWKKSRIGWAIKRAGIYLEKLNTVLSHTENLAEIVNQTRELYTIATEKGDLKTAAQLLRLLTKLHGLETPTKVQIEGLPATSEAALANAAEKVLLAHQAIRGEEGKED